ncbi:MAG: hypothetical protein ACI9N1_002493 [Flavobacteriales bacterium]|jgi:hypothetical protein
MKNVIHLITLFFLISAQSKSISPKYYWLGFSKYGEYEIGINKTPGGYPIRVYLDEFDFLKIYYVSKLCNVKFKRTKYKKDCSNCDEFFFSRKVSKHWKVLKYFNFEKTEYDTTESIQWYQSSFIPEVLFDANQLEQTSYLKGLFLRTGSKDSTSYQVIINDAVNQAFATKELLNNIRAKNVSLNSAHILREYYHKRSLFNPLYIKFYFQENHTFASSLKKSSYF